MSYLLPKQGSFPSSASHLSAAEAAGAPSTPDFVYKLSDRPSNVGWFGVDEYNQQLMNQYNNEYNYWLWLKQMEYNSPSEQVKRLKEAGLNPNFNSIEGAGNAGSIPTSQGSVKGNQTQSRLNAIGSGISAATALATGISKGVTALKAIASTPRAIKAYRGLLTEVLGEKYTRMILDNQLKSMQNKAQGYYYGLGMLEPGMEDSLWLRSQESKVSASEWSSQLLEKRLAYQDLLNQMATWDLNNLKPQQLDNLKATWDFITAGTSLRQINLSWFNANQSAQIVRALAPFFIKLF